MKSARWFGSVMMEASYPSEPIMLEELERVLDSAHPSAVDPEKSEAYDGSFVIAHGDSFLGNIELEVWADWADLSSIVTSRKITATEFGPAWIHETARAVEQIIRGSYGIVRTRWRNKVIRTDVTSDSYTRTDQTVWSRLPLPRRFLTYERFILDYDCIDPNPADSTCPPEPD